MTDHQFDWITVHCAATPPSWTGSAEQIASWHRGSFPNWSARAARLYGRPIAGYFHFIDRDGNWQSAERGDPLTPHGGHGCHIGECNLRGTPFRNLNTRAAGVCLAGGVDAKGRPEDNFTDKQWARLQSDVLPFLWEGSPNTKPNDDIWAGGTWGHRDFIKAAMTEAHERRIPTRARPKACPSTSIKTRLATRSVAADLKRREDEGSRLGFLLDLVPPAAVFREPFEIAADLLRTNLGLPIPDLSPATHTVVKGDTLYAISRVYGVTVKEICALNGIAPDRADRVPVGTELRIFR